MNVTETSQLYETDITVFREYELLLIGIYVPPKRIHKVDTIYGTFQIIDPYEKWYNSIYGGDYSSVSAIFWVFQWI